MTDSVAEKELVHSVLAAFEARDSDRLLSLCAPDVVFEFPFLGLVIAAEEFAQKIMPTLAIMNDLTFTEITVEPLVRPGWYLARYRGSATMSNTGKPYRQKYITLVGSHDGRLTHFHEYFDTATFAAAIRHDPTA